MHAIGIIFHVDTTYGGTLLASEGNAAHIIRQEGPLSAEDIFTRCFADLYPNDSQFLSTFSKKSIRITALARHILTEINNNLNGQQNNIRENSHEFDLEHILPKKFKDHWQKNAEDFPGGPHKYIHRLGNMTLIAPELNRKLGNADFKVKKDVYKTNCLDITKRILEEPHWSADAINRRQNWLANEAAKIWRFPLNNGAT